jgi:TM2 domain-containing membrane protein YozV
MQLTMKEPKDKSVSYLLWLAFLLGGAGLHRIYLGRYISGAFYLVTWGWFGVGQLLDLVLIPGMVDEENLKYMALRGGVGYTPGLQAANQIALVEKTGRSELLEVTILRICRERGEATRSDCIIDSGADRKDVTATLKMLVHEDLLTVHNRDSDGSVVYRAV